MDPTKLNTQSSHETLQLLSETAQQISGAALIRPAFRSEDQDLDASTSGPYCRACKFYGITLDEDENKAKTQIPRSDVPVVTAFEDLVVLSTTYARAIVNVSDKRHRVLESFVSILTLMTSLTDRLDQHQITVDWEPTQWLSAVLATLDQASDFRHVMTIAG